MDKNFTVQLRLGDWKESSHDRTMKLSVGHLPEDTQRRLITAAEAWQDQLYNAAVLWLSMNTPKEEQPSE